MGLALLCSGQGAQHPAMFAMLAQETASKPLLQAISARLGLDVRTLASCLAADDLHANRTAQLLVVGHALAASLALAHHGLTAVAVHAGYSVGELAAHACAGCVGPEAALDLALARANVMDKAALAAGVPLGMSGVVGLDASQIARAMADTGVALAIVNGPDHVVVGGPVAELSLFETRATAMGARHVRRLPVRTASHTWFLAAAGPAFADDLAGVGWTAGGAPVLSGLDGHAVRNAADARATLSAQIHQPLDWHRCLMASREYGATAFLELGPGRALTKIVEQVFPDMPARALDDFRTIQGAARWARRWTGAGA